MLRRHLLLAVPLAGCSPPVQLNQSNRDPAYKQRLDRVLVVQAFYHERMMTDAQKNVFIKTTELKQSLVAKWASLGLTVETLDLDAAGDKRKALADAVASFAPNQVLELKTANWRVRGGLVSIVDGYSIDASLLDVATKKRVWRAVVEFNDFTHGGRTRNGPLGMGLSHQDDANDLADVLLVKLKADGLV